MINELSNPVAKTLLNHLRETQTDALRFRHIVQELSRLLAYEALKKEILEDQTITVLGKEKKNLDLLKRKILFLSLFYVQVFL